MPTVSCPFCELNRERILRENELTIAIADGFPVSPGHTLLIPKRHTPTWFDATPEEQQSIISLLNSLKETLDRDHNPDGYNIGINCGEAAGQTVPHLHIHLIPRFQGDMENPRGGVRGVIPDKQKY